METLLYGVADDGDILLHIVAITDDQGERVESRSFLIVDGRRVPSNTVTARVTTTRDEAVKRIVDFERDAMATAKTFGELLKLAIERGVSVSR